MVFPAQGGRLTSIGGMNRTIPFNNFGKKCYKNRSKKMHSKRKSYKKSYKKSKRKDKKKR